MNGGEELKEREKGMKGRKQDVTVETGKGKVVSQLSNRATNPAVYYSPVEWFRCNKLGI